MHEHSDTWQICIPSFRKLTKVEPTGFLSPSYPSACTVSVSFVTPAIPSGSCHMRIYLHKVLDSYPFRWSDYWKGDNRLQWKHLFLDISIYTTFESYWVFESIIMMQSAANDMSINDHIGIIFHAQLLILFLLIIPKIGNYQ